MSSTVPNSRQTLRDGDVDAADAGGGGAEEAEGGGGGPVHAGVRPQQRLVALLEGVAAAPGNYSSLPLSFDLEICRIMDSESLRMNPLPNSESKFLKK